MADMEKAAATQLANIEKKTGKSLPQLRVVVAKSGKVKHGEIRAWLMEKYGLGHGDANTLTHFTLRQGEGPKPSSTSDDAVLDDIYVGKKAHLRAVHDRLMAAIAKFGDFEIAPKKAYVSLRRKKQFAMLGPKTNERFELGLNIKEEVRDSRVKALPTGGMCQYVVALASVEEVDAKLIAIVKRAYDAAG